MSANTPSPASPEASVQHVPVLLVGGPPDWDGKTLSGVYTQADLTGPRESLGTYLISSGVPDDHPDPGARAVYEPAPEPGAANVWFFRGWFPVGPHDPELRTPARETDVDVVLARYGLPAAFTPVGTPGETLSVQRVLAHWSATGEDDLAPDVWHVATPAGADWCLSDHGGGRWTGGELPALPPARQEHPDLLG